MATVRECGELHAPFHVKRRLLPRQGSGDRSRTQKKRPTRVGWAASIRLRGVRLFGDDDHATLGLLALALARHTVHLGDGVVDDLPLERAHRLELLLLARL